MTPPSLDDLPNFIAALAALVRAAVATEPRRRPQALVGYVTLLEIPYSMLVSDMVY